MKNRGLYLHYLGLAGAIALGTILRFWHLDLKSLWMDEVITAIFSLGKNYHDLPLDVVFPLKRLHEIFTFQSGVSCSQIAQNLATQSTHPPLFFCAMYRWLGWPSPLGEGWVEKLRSLPALFGVGAIVAIYGVNRIAFSPSSGIFAALLMAVSPFAVYLSQEARHYTLPMLLITLALLGLMQIQRDIIQGYFRFWVWFLWIIINSIGFYVHYFFILAFVAEIATLILLIYAHKSTILIRCKIWRSLLLSIGGVTVSFIPWLLITLNHARSSETNWLPPPINIAPPYQTLINWVLMVIALPVENQPLVMAIICGLIMVIFATWLGWQVFQGLKQMWLNHTTYVATFTLLSFTIFILLELFAITYLLGKDITAVPRYSFVYYPSFCALLAASLSNSQKSKVKGQQSILIVIIIGLISCIFVVSNLAFQKPFQPERVAQNMNLEPDVPLMLVVAYSNYQDAALGLSFALELEQLRNKNPRDKSQDLNSGINSDSLAILNKNSNLSDFWTKLNQLSIPLTSHLNLWIVAPGLRRRDYPQQIDVSGKNNCTIDASQHYRIGVPYQLYRCRKKG